MLCIEYFNEIRVEWKYERKGRLIHSVMVDGRYLLLSCADGAAVQKWDILTQSVVHRYKVHASGTRAVAVLGDGRFVLGTWKSTLLLWNVDGEDVIRQFISDTGVDVCVHPTDSYEFLAYYHAGGVVRWRLMDDQKARLHIQHRLSQLLQASIEDSGKAVGLEELGLDVDTTVEAPPLKPEGMRQHKKGVKASNVNRRY
jgi:hypothetical protein